MARSEIRGRARHRPLTPIWAIVAYAPRRLGQQCETVNAEIKTWAVGAPLQAPIDAVDILRRRHPFEADEVRRIMVRLAPSGGAVVDNRDIPDICLQHMVAVMPLDETASFHAAHDKARMQGAELLRARRNVTDVPDPSLDRLLPVRLATMRTNIGVVVRAARPVMTLRCNQRTALGDSRVKVGKPTSEFFVAHADSWWDTVWRALKCLHFAR